MLWSQMKLTSYDFSDLHITGEFDNRPGTGGFFRNLYWVVTYRTGACRRLNMKTSADARPGTVRCRTVPCRRYKRSAGHRTVPGRLTRIFTCNNEYIYIKIRHHSSKETGCSNKKLTLTVILMKTTLAQDCKIFNSTCLLHVNHPKLLKRKKYFCIYVFGL